MLYFHCLRIVVLQKLVVVLGGEAEPSVAGDGEWVVVAVAAVMELLAVEGLLWNSWKHCHLADVCGDHCCIVPHRQLLRGELQLEREIMSFRLHQSLGGSLFRLAYAGCRVRPVKSVRVRW